jgi:hypothetical protein
VQWLRVSPTSRGEEIYPDLMERIHRKGWRIGRACRISKASNEHTAEWFGPFDRRRRVKS